MSFQRNVQKKFNTRKSVVVYNIRSAYPLVASSRRSRETEKITRPGVCIKKPVPSMSSVAGTATTTKKRKPETISCMESQDHDQKKAKIIQEKVKSVLFPKGRRVLEKPKPVTVCENKSLSYSTKIEGQDVIKVTTKAVEELPKVVLPTRARVVEKRLETRPIDEAAAPKSKAPVMSEWRKLPQGRDRRRQREAAQMEIEKIEKEHEKAAAAGEMKFQNIEAMQQLEILCGFSVSCQCNCLHYKGFTSVMDMGASQVVGHGIPLKKLGLYLRDE